MQLNDLVFGNIIFNTINKINTGYIIIDSLFFIMFLFYLSESTLKDKIIKLTTEYIKKYDKTYKLKFSTTEKEASRNFKAIMHWISKNNDPSVRTLMEPEGFRKYNRKTDCYEESKISDYRVDQIREFNVDKNIKGRVYYKQKESRYLDKKEYTDITFLEIYSTKLCSLDLQNWVEKKCDEYETYLRSKTCSQQLLVEISWDPKEKDQNVYFNPWKSNVTFDNRFFTKKDDILNKINFFINNPEWYERRGVPYTLGILLWGEPGCGKTGFIKALMNLTGRHGISIKLNNRFNMNKLRDIMFNEEINDEIIIPQQNRILIFEDIDCMGDVIQDRNIKDQKKEMENEEIIKKSNKKNSDSEDDMAISKLIAESDNNYNNNLSYFLNILDGLQESPGRIIVMTTNKPETLDKAFIRPGRIDFNICFNKATTEDIKNILIFFWEKPVDDLSDELNYVYSHAEISNFCRISESLEETIQKIISKNNI
jgi:hypothetical protein